MSQLIDYFHPDSQTSIEYAFLYATGVVLGTAFSAFSNHVASFHTQLLGMRVRVATSALVFRKAIQIMSITASFNTIMSKALFLNQSLRLSQKSLNETPLGHMINIISNDVNRFGHVFGYLHYMWSGPLATIFATICLYNVIGLASLLSYFYSFLYSVYHVHFYSLPCMTIIFYDI